MSETNVIMNKEFLFNHNYLSPIVRSPSHTMGNSLKTNKKEFALFLLLLLEYSHHEVFTTWGSGRDNRQSKSLLFTRGIEILRKNSCII